MRRIFALLAFLPLMIFAQTKNAAKYNNKIIEMQHKLITQMSGFAGSISSTPYEKLKAEKDDIEVALDKAIAKIDAMPAFQGDSKLRDAALEWFKMSKKIIDDDFEVLLPILSKKDKSPEDKTKIKELIDKIVVDEDAIIVKFEKAQEDFVQTHGLDLVEHPVKL